MKKIKFLIIFLIAIAGISILLFLCLNKKDTYSIDSELEKMGYNTKQIEIIKTLNNPEKVLNYDYNKKIPDIISNKEFNEKNLDNYIELISSYSFSIDDIIFIVNSNYYKKDIEYTDKVINFMKQEFFVFDNLERYLNYNSDSDDLNYIITMVNSNRDYEYYTEVKDADLSKGYLVLVNKYNRLSNTYVPDNLVSIDSKYGTGGQLEKTVYEKYQKMWQDAYNQGLYLYIRSPYRSYSTQNSLYERYASVDGYSKADTYSARPGYSEHQTGLAFDVTNKNSNLGGFESTKEFNWMKDNAYKYGFILRYPKGKENITGYIYESWHYRYVGEEVAKIIYEKDITYDEYYAYYVK